MNAVAVEIVCPLWCVSDHAGYSDRALLLGDVITHEGDLSGVGGFTIQLDDADEQPFTVQRFQQVTPAGEVLADGWRIGDDVMTSEQAAELGRGILEQIGAQR